MRVYKIVFIILFASDEVCDRMLFCGVGPHCGRRPLSAWLALQFTPALIGAQDMGLRRAFNCASEAGMWTGWEEVLMKPLSVTLAHLRHTRELGGGGARAKSQVKSMPYPPPLFGVPPPLPVRLV